FSPASRLLSCVTKSLPITTSSFLQASAYTLKLLGNAFLNCKAMPLPITPTVFTVFTNAWASLSKILPVRYLIIVLLIIRLGDYFYYLFINAKIDKFLFGGFVIAY